MTTKTGRTIMDVCVLLDGIMLTYTGLASIPKARSQLAIGVGFAMIITGTTCLFVSVLTLMTDGVAATTHWWQAIATAAIAWLLGGGYEGITHALVNSLATVSGMICDGAKPSCAAKIATAVDVGILGYQMYKDGQQFYGGDGIVTKGVENTIRNIGRLGHDGMRETDKEIIRIMTGL